MMNAEEKKQMMIVGAVAISLLILGVLCFTLSKKKDNYNVPPMDEYLWNKNFVDQLSTCAECTSSFLTPTPCSNCHLNFNDITSLHACGNCINNHLTPGACTKCDIFKRQHSFYKPGV